MHPLVWLASNLSDFSREIALLFALCTTSIVLEIASTNVCLIYLPMCWLFLFSFSYHTVVLIY